VETQTDRRIPPDALSSRLTR